MLFILLLQSQLLFRFLIQAQIILRDYCNYLIIVMNMFMFLIMRQFVLLHFTIISKLSLAVTMMDR